MEFRLFYRGALPAASASDTRSADKTRIRRVFHEQMKALWNEHPSLRHSSDPLQQKRIRHKMEPQRTLVSPQNEKYRFLYLVGGDLGVSCSLDILMLRRGGEGGPIRHGGDLDNRLKVLFDSLRAPQESNELPKGAPLDGEDPFYCVLQDDKFIDKVTISTDRLLVPVDQRINEKNNDVILIIT